MRASGFVVVVWRRADGTVHFVANETAPREGQLDAVRRPFFARRLSKAEESCDGHLIACDVNLYHSQMQLPFVQHNLVTMLRDPGRFAGPERQHRSLVVAAAAAARVR